MRRFLAILRTRPARIALTFLLTALLAVLLVATIYWSRFDVPWLAFLGGVLLAAVLAIASQASKAEWLVMRRTRQLERARGSCSAWSPRAAASRRIRFGCSNRDFSWSAARCHR